MKNSEIKLPNQLVDHYDILSDKDSDSIGESIRYLDELDYADELKPHLKGKRMIGEDGWGNSLLYDKENDTFHEHIHDWNPEELKRIDMKDYLTKSELGAYFDASSNKSGFEFQRPKPSNKFDSLKLLGGAAAGIGLGSLGTVGLIKAGVKNDGALQMPLALGAVGGFIGGASWAGRKSNKGEQDELMDINRVLNSDHTNINTARQGLSHRRGEEFLLNSKSVPNHIKDLYKNDIEKTALTVNEDGSIFADSQGMWMQYDDLGNDCDDMDSIREYENTANKFVNSHRLADNIKRIISIIKIEHLIQVTSILI